jgi:O-antigen/teichoic acid export membrane protein
VQLDRATGYAVFGKLWQVFAGPITLILIAQYLEPEAQGLYYTFISLAALQSFVELGFFVAITQFASHEWAKLNLDSEGYIKGDLDALSRLISLGHIVFKWYSCIAIIFIALVGFGGYYFLSLESSFSLNWKSPWTIFIVLSGLELWLMPFLALLEGCNQVSNIYLLRLYQSIVRSLITWHILIIGGELWVAAGTVGAGLLVALISVIFKYRKFFKPFFSPAFSKKISWQEEMWPMQWRLAIGGSGTYLVNSIYTPIIFHYHGPILAGKMGMTFQLASTISSLAIAWIATKAPRFGMFIAQKKWRELDELFLRTALASIGVIILGSLSLLGIVYGLNVIEHPFAQRILPPLPTGILMLAFIFLQGALCMYYYLRAHKKEPVMKLNIGYALLNGLLVWALGSQMGPLGATIAFLLSTGLVLLPLTLRIFIRCRKEWHHA